MWLTDPKDNKKSVTLTLLIISFLTVIVGSVVDMPQLPVALQTFLTCGGIYLGRRNIKIGNNKLGD